MNSLTASGSQLPSTGNPLAADDTAAIKNLVIKKISITEENRSALKAKRELLRDTLREDNEYKQLEENIKEAKKRLEENKTRQMKKPQIAQLESDIKQLNRQQREARKDISDYLVMYADKTGQLSFIHPNGNTIRIEKQAKTRIVIQKASKGKKRKNEMNSPDFGIQSQT